jgi:hypothetical protein
MFRQIGLPARRSARDERSCGTEQTAQFMYERKKKSCEMCEE